MSNKHNSLIEKFKIGDIIKGGTDLMKAGIKHRQEMKEKMI